MIARLLLFVITALPLLGIHGQVRAEVTRTDLQVAARVLSFLERSFSDTARMGIVYASDSERSQQQAEAVREMLDGGLRAGNLVLQPVMLPLPNLGEQEADFLFLTEYVAMEAAKGVTRSGVNGLPCLTTDMAKVESGVCPIGVRSSPRVEIFVNRSSAAERNIRFSSAFRMMIQEI